MAEDPTPPARVVVTVPASFQVAQRRATRDAAALAGFAVAGGDLLDEPVAAFLDYMASAAKTPLASGADPLNLVVFDFGGGTCDVAVLTIGPGQRATEFGVAPRAVSRYHRLGGGDIDAAIVYEVLLPELLRQNGLAPQAVEFEEKKRVIEPALRGIAESLKVALCEEIARLQAFGRYDRSRLSAVTSRLGLVHPIVLPTSGRTLELRNPTLTAEELERLLEPFLDRDLLYARDTEYRLTCSIFAPLQDALDRASLRPENIDVLLLVGGSTLSPHVRAAVRDYAPRARVLVHPDPESVQVAVARGAAWHALALAVTGRGLIQPISHDTISLRTQDRLFALVPAGAPLPFPGGTEMARREGLLVPVTSTSEPVPVRVELVAGEPGHERLLHGGRWDVPAPVTAGEGLFVEYRFDENQVLEVALGLASDPEGHRYACTIENPLTHVVNPSATRLKLEELEEAIRTGAIPSAEVLDALVEAAALMSELGQRERAFAQLARVLRRKGRPDAAILNRMAILAGEMGDAERQERLYLEAFEAAPGWTPPLFNLALAQYRRRAFAAAHETLARALRTDRPIPHLVLAAQIAAALGREKERDAHLREALDALPPLVLLGDWELGWLAAGAAMAGNESLARRCSAELKARQETSGRPAPRDGVLPALKTDWLM